MPELPEVETVTTGLNFAIKNLIVKKVYVQRYDLRVTVSKNIKSVINNVKVIGVQRRAKYGIIQFDNNYSIIFHLGMSGTIHIVENKMKLKSKRIKDEYVRIPLTPLQTLHFKLLYSIAYINKLYPDKISKFNFSEDLSELLDNEKNFEVILERLKIV